MVHYSREHNICCIIFVIGKGTRIGVMPFINDGVSRDIVSLGFLMSGLPSLNLFDDNRGS